MTEHHWGDLVAPYVLGALDEHETGDFEAHLAGCEACRLEVAEMSVVPAALAEAVPERTAPRDLRDRVLTTVRAEADLLAAAGPEADRPSPGRPRWRIGSPPLRLATALAAVTAVIVAGVLGFALRGGPDDLRARTIPAQVSEAAGLGARAALERRGERRTLRVERFEGPGRGRVYQVWTQASPAADPEPTPVLFTVGRDGAAAVELPAAARTAPRVLVSSEPAGGSPTGVPSGAPVVIASG
jgi:anti-sigma-K factor RskA